MDLAQVQLDLRILELDLRFRGGLWLSPPLKFSSPIGLRPSPTLKFSSPTANPRSSDFSVGLELPSSYLELGTWMLEEY